MLEVPPGIYHGSSQQPALQVGQHGLLSGPQVRRYATGSQRQSEAAVGQAEPNSWGPLGRPHRVFQVLDEPGDVDRLRLAVTATLVAAATGQELLAGRQTVRGLTHNST